MSTAVDHAARPGAGGTDADELRMLRDSAIAFCARESSPARVRGLRGTRPGFDSAVWKKMADQGWLGILSPESFGGSGLGCAAMRVVAEELARALVPEPLAACAVLARGALLYGDNNALRQTLLPKLAAGDLMASLACQEAAGGIVIDNVATTARREGSSVVLNGTKRFVTPAAGVDGYIVSAREDAELALYWVPAAATGIESSLEPRADGTFSATVRLNDVRIDVANRIAHGAVAHDALARALDEAIVIASAELFGVMDRALASMLEYMKTRVQFGKPIGSFQALQHRAVDLYIQKELAVGALDDAVRVLDGGADARPRSLAASRAKSRCADAALLITREAIKLHGAIGFADECDIGLYFQRALVLAAWLGNGALHRRRFSALTIDDVIPTPAKSPSRAAGAGLAAAAGTVRESPPDADWNAMSDEEFRSEVRAYFETNYPQELRYLNRRARWSETRDWALRMSAKGWIAPAWPREHGGMGLSPGKLLIYMEEQERWGVARAPDQGILLLGPLLIRYGTEEQKRKYLPAIISCEHVWCQGYSEPNSGSDLASLRTEAVADGDEFVINGSKIWTTLAHDATHMFLLVRTDKSAKRQEGISFFLLDLKTPGVRIRPIRNIEGHEELCEEFFENVRIPKGNLVGELNRGWPIAKTLLGFERLNHGSPRRAQYPMQKLEIVARQRGVWNDAEFQSKYVKLRLDVDDLAAAYARYADIVRSGRNPGPDISFLKIWATETFQRLAELLIELAGEAGCLRGEIDFGAELVDVLGPYYIVFPATIASGSNEIQRNILAKRVLNLPS
ncbi:MAG: acyl-CoA dehydrogenase [Betaproteobacteria bacterium]|nr:acyl-CoA dehydrogenase [Betaproteobacteria bacterium]